MDKVEVAEAYLTAIYDQFQTALDNRDFSAARNVIDRVVGDGYTKAALVLENDLTRFKIGR